MNTLYENRMAPLSDMSRTVGTLVRRLADDLTSDGERMTAAGGLEEALTNFQRLRHAGYLLDRECDVTCMPRGPDAEDVYVSVRHVSDCAVDMWWTVPGKDGARSAGVQVEHEDGYFTIRSFCNGFRSSISVPSAKSGDPLAHASSMVEGVVWIVADLVWSK